MDISTINVTQFITELHEYGFNPNIFTLTGKDNIIIIGDQSILYERISDIDDKIMYVSSTYKPKTYGSDYWCSLRSLNTASHNVNTIVYDITKNELTNNIEKICNKMLETPDVNHVIYINHNFDNYFAKIINITKMIQYCDNMI
jgi:hypothetical protein